MSCLIRARRFGIAGVVALAFGPLLSVPAFGHAGTGLPGGFMAGFAHPLTGVDHLLAMVSVGLWGAVLGRPLIYVLPVIFPVMMVVGAIAGMTGVPVPPPEIGVALSVLVLGGCIALSVKAPLWAASMMVAAFAVFHGYAHGKELPSAADPISYSLGFVLVTGSLHLTGIALGALDTRPGGVTATRGLGGLISVVGAWFFYQATIA